MDVRLLSALVAPTKAFSRTAKSCGPDPPTLQGNRIWILEGYCLDLQEGF